MKVGTQNRKVVIAASVLLAFATFLFVRMLLVWTSAAASVPPPKRPGGSDLEQALAPSVPAGPRRATRRGKPAATQPTLDPRLSLSLLAKSESVKYDGTGRNIFDRESAPPIPRVLENPRKHQAEIQQQQQPQGPPPPPPPPPIPLKFFGFANTQGEPKQVFLSQGSEDVFVARQGDVVNRRYKVVKINPSSVEIEDLLTNSRQTIPLTQG